MALAVALIMGLLLIFLIVTAITLFFTYWYITFPAVALIIIYKKRKSIRKAYKGYRWDLKFRKRGPKLYTHGAMPSSEWHKRDEWVRQQSADDERRRKEFWENFWKQYESEFRQKNDYKALDDETAEDRRKRGDENFEEAWEEYKEKFEQDEDENYAKYYLLLGLKQSATYDELRQRFRELALKYHPDKNKTKKIQAAKKFTKILEAYEKIIESMRMKKCAV